MNLRITAGEGKGAARFSINRVEEGVHFTDLIVDPFKGVFGQVIVRAHKLPARSSSFTRMENSVVGQLVSVFCGRPPGRDLRLQATKVVGDIKRALEPDR